MKVRRSTWVVVVVFSLCSTPLFAEPPSVSSPGEDSQLSHLRGRIDSALSLTKRRYLSPEQHTPWQIAHGMIAFGRDFRLRRVSDREYVNAVDYFSGSPGAATRQIFRPTSYGLEPLSGVEFEGHPDQFLAIFAQIELPLDHQIRAGGRDYQIADLVDQAMLDYYPGQEASWTLISLSTYLPIDATWQNQSGRRLSIEDLVHAEISAEPTTGACGGTHNLFALAYAVKRIRAVRQRLSGVWQRAEAKIQRYKQIARSLQNSDGSFSSNYFEGPGSAVDDSEAMETTGHTLEWLALALSDDEIQEPWVTDSVESLVGVFERTSRQPMDCGPLYHAAHALALYRDRMDSIEDVLVQAPEVSGSVSDPVAGSADPSAP